VNVSKRKKIALKKIQVEIQVNSYNISAGYYIHEMRSRESSRGDEKQRVLQGR